MSRVKIKTVKQGKIDASTFSIRRRLDVDIEVIKKLITDSSEFVPEKKSAPTRKMEGDEVKKELPSPEKKIVIGEQGEITWKGGFPDELRSLIDQINAVYNVSNEINSYSLTIWPPREKHKSGNVEVKTIPKASISTGMRVILVVGHRENFEMTAEAQGSTGSGNVICFNGESFSVPIGVATAIEYKFNNKTVVYQEARKGHRKTKITKDPSKVYVCVIDGSINAGVLMNKIKKEAVKLSGGNRDLSKQIEKHTSDIFSLDDIGEVLKKINDDESSA